MADGVDPPAEKHKKAAKEITVERAFNKFFDARPDLAKTTIDNFSRTGFIYLKPWAKKPINEIKRQMVLKNHQEMSRKTAKSQPMNRSTTSARSTTLLPQRKINCHQIQSEFLAKQG